MKYLLIVLMINWPTQRFEYHNIPASDLKSCEKYLGLFDNIVGNTIRDHPNWAYRADCVEIGREVVYKQ